jgi:pyrroline-5-carboxylate reductase
MLLFQFSSRYSSSSTYLILSRSTSLCSIWQQRQRSKSSTTTTTTSSNRSNNIKDENFKLGIIGIGKIAQAIIFGLINKNKLKAHQIYASESNLNHFNYLKNKHPFFQEHKINLLYDNRKVLKETNTVLLCVKPNELIKTLKINSDDLTNNHLLISIAAGICIEKIEKCLKNDVRVIRIMTNMAALVLQGCSVFARGTHANNDDIECVKTLLEAIGTCEGQVNEELMDVITALSGSGPAYMYIILDALADGGVKMGLTRDMALKLATQSMFGSSVMLLDELQKSTNGSSKHLLQFKEEVCSPGGSTIHGIAELEKYNLRYALIRCIEMATKRAKELNEINNK